MFRINRRRPWPTDIDLSTARETLAYLEDDMRRVPGLEKVAQAIAVAMAEIEAAEKAAPYAMNYSPMVSHFVPRRPG